MTRFRSDVLMGRSTARKSDFAKSIELQLVRLGMSKRALADALGLEPWQVSRLLKLPNAAGSKWAKNAAAAVAKELGLQAEATAFLKIAPSHGAEFVAASLANPDLTDGSRFEAATGEEYAALPLPTDPKELEAFDRDSALQASMGIAPGAEGSPVVYLAGLTLNVHVERAAARLLEARRRIRRLVPDVEGAANAIPSELQKFGDQTGYEVWRMPSEQAPFLGAGFFVVPPWPRAFAEELSADAKHAAPREPLALPGLYVWWGDDHVMRFTEPEPLRTLTALLDKWCLENHPAVKAFSRIDQRSDIVAFEKKIDEAEQRAHEKNGTIRLVKDGPGFAWMNEDIYERRRLANKRSADEELALELDFFQARRRRRFEESSAAVGAVRKHILTRNGLRAFAKRGAPAKDECFLPFMEAEFSVEDRTTMLDFARSRLTMPGGRYQICLVPSRNRLPRYNKGRSLLWEVVSYDDSDEPPILFLVTYPEHKSPLMYIVSDPEIVRIFSDEFDTEWARLQRSGGSLSVEGVDQYIAIARSSTK